jgi:hypothetical protein
MSSAHASQSSRRARRAPWSLIVALASATFVAPAFAAIECPTTGARDVANVKPDWKDGDFPLDADDIVTGDKIDAIVQRVRRDQPGVSYPALIDSLTAAYCPIVARESGRTDDQKRAQIARFETILERRIAAAAADKGDEILAQVPLSSSVMRAVSAAAAKAGETPDKWMADVVSKAAVASQ